LLAYGFHPFAHGGFRHAEGLGHLLVGGAFALEFKGGKRRICFQSGGRLFFWLITAFYHAARGQPINAAIYKLL